MTTNQEIIGLQQLVGMEKQLGRLARATQLLNWTTLSVLVVAVTLFFTPYKTLAISMLVVLAVGYVWVRNSLMAQRNTVARQYRRRLLEENSA
jgi:hypothetical protein